MSWALVAQLRGRQEQDAGELGRTQEDWGGKAAVVMYRCEVDSRGVIHFADLTGTR
jgi:hypothetical protein